MTRHGSEREQVQSRVNQVEKAISVMRAAQIRVIDVCFREKVRAENRSDFSRILYKLRQKYSHQFHKLRNKLLPMLSPAP